MNPSRQFTKREAEVIELLLQGKSNKQIALALGISKSTVEFHIKNIYFKLGVGSRAEAILNLSKNNLLESIANQPTGNLWQTIGEESQHSEYSSQEKQFFDPQEEKSMKNRTMISISLSVIALLVAFGVFAYLRFETISSESPVTASPAAPVIHTPRGILQIPPEASTRYFDEVLLMLQSPQPSFHYAAVFTSTGCFVRGENTCSFTHSIPFPAGESLSGVSIYWMPNGENGFYVQDNQIFILNHLERKTAASDVLISNILLTSHQLHISPDGRWLVESVQVNDPYASDLVLIKTSTGKTDKLNIGLEECFKDPLGWMTQTKFMFRCDVSAGATPKKNRIEQRFYTYDVSSTELSEIASGLDNGFDTLSPNGKYAIRYEKQNFFHVIDLGSGETYPTALPDGQVVWSHDSSKLAVFGDNGDIYISEHDGSNQRKIYSSGATGYLSMEWFPNNKYIALVAYFNEDLQQTRMVILSTSGEVIKYDQIPTTDGYIISGISPLPAIQTR